MNPATLAAICRWTGDEHVFWNAMVETFLDIEGDVVVAHEWETINSRLIHNWTVGPKGGRPSKPNENAEITQGITQGVTDREDREEKIDKKEREVTFSSMKEAVLFFQDEFPDRPVKLSLSDLIRKKGKESLTEEYGREWLTSEKRRKKPKEAAAPESNSPTEEGMTDEERKAYLAEHATQLEALRQRLGQGVRNGAEEAA
jgi:hypothetical protein